MEKIVFAHNVYNRLSTLKDTITIENQIFPDSNISVAYNGQYVNIFGEINGLSFIKFNETPHKIGCVNGCILSIQQLLKYDFDVLIFSHDDVHINKNYLDVVNKHIESIVNKEYDIICRFPINPELGEKYYMMEVFYASKDAVMALFDDAKTMTDENEIPLDIRGSISPEVWLYNFFNNKNFKINTIGFKINSNDNYNILLGEQMGYYHKNVGIRGWKD